MFLLPEQTLERARSAEAEAKTLRDAQKEEVRPACLVLFALSLFLPDLPVPPYSQVKSVTTLTATLSSTTASLAQSQAAYSTLSSSFSTLKTQWSTDLAAVRADYTRLQQESARLEGAKLGEKVDVWEARKEEGRRLRGKREEVRREWERVVRGEMEVLRGRVEKLLGGGSGEEGEDEEEGEEGLKRRVEEALDGESTTPPFFRSTRRRRKLTRFAFRFVFAELTNLRRMIKKGSGAAASPPISPSPSPSPSLVGKPE